MYGYILNTPTFLKDYIGLTSWGAEKIAPDPHPNLPKYEYRIDPWRIGNSTLGYPEAAEIASPLAYEMFIKYLSKTGGEYTINPQDIINLEEGEPNRMDYKIILIYWHGWL